MLNPLGKRKMILLVDVLVITVVDLVFLGCFMLCKTLSCSALSYFISISTKLIYAV